MAKKELRNIKFEPKSDHKLLGEKVVTNIAAEKCQDVVKIYPKYMTMAGYVNKKLLDEMPRKCDVNLEENKHENLASNTTFDDELNRSKFFIRQTGSSTFPLQLESCFEEFNYGEINCEYNVNLLDWDTELKNKISSNNPISTIKSIFDKSISERYLSKKVISAVPQFTVNEMTICNSGNEIESINVIKYFDNDVKKGRRKNVAQGKDSTLSIFEMKDHFKKVKDFQSSNEKYAELEKQMLLFNYNINEIYFDKQVCEEYAFQNYVPLIQQLRKNKMVIHDSPEVESAIKAKNFYDNDVKLDNCRNLVQIRESTETLSEEKDQIKELKKVFERLATCLLNHLETFQNRNLKLEEGNILNLKSHGWQSSYKYNKTNKIGKNTSETLKSHSLEDNFITRVKQGIDTATCFSPIDNSENAQMVISNSESCACGFCDGSWVDVQSIRKKLSGGDQLEVSKMSNQKINRLSISERGDLTNNLNLSATLQKSHSKSKSGKLDLPFHHLPSSVINKTVLIANEPKNNINNCRVIHRSKAPKKEPCENYTSSSEESNMIKKEKNKECCRRRDKESKHIKIYLKNDQLGKHEDNNEVIDDEIDSNEMLFFLFIFIIPGLFSLLLFLIIFI